MSDVGGQGRARCASGRWFARAGQAVARCACGLPQTRREYIPVASGVAVQATHGLRQPACASRPVRHGLWFARAGQAVARGASGLRQPTHASVCIPADESAAKLAERTCGAACAAGDRAPHGRAACGERVRQGWRTPALPAMQDCIAEQAALEPTGMIALATSLWLALRAAFAVQIGNPADLSRRVPGCASFSACQRRSAPPTDCLGLEWSVGRGSGTSE
jgi:hypothetical protein